MDKAKLHEYLSAYADGELDATQAAEVEAAVQGDVTLKREMALYRRLDQAAAALPVPQLAEDTGQALWSLVSDQAFPADSSSSGADASSSVGADWSDQLPQVPTVGEDRWQSVWSNIQAQTQDVANNKGQEPAATLPKATTTKFNLPLQADFTPVNQSAVDDGAATPASTAADNVVRPPATFWKTTGLVAVAAMLLLVATMSLAPGLIQPHTPDTPVAQPDTVEHEEVADDYVMMVKHVPGLDEPVTVLVSTK